MSELQVVGSGKPQSPVSLATRSASLDSLDSSASEDEEPNAQVYVYNLCTSSYGASTEIHWHPLLT